MKQKTVLITGASRGIGAETARLFAEDGYAVAINYHRSEDKALALVRELQAKGHRVLPVQADVSDFAQVQAMMDSVIQAFGQLDTLVCNAGIGHAALLTDTTVEEWRELFAVNVDGVYHCCKLAIPHLLRQGAGQIVMVSSMWGLVGASFEVPYSATKSAVIGLMKGLAQELAPSHITVNCVAPGLIDTEMNENLSKEDIKDLEEQTPLGRMGTAQEVAESILFLASEKASFFTGQTLSPNGGFVT